MDQNQPVDQTPTRAPRQIAIGILDDDAPRSSMKILSMPAITTSASKVVDFRQITMKSDFNQALLGGTLKDDSIQGKVITKDLIVNAKDMFNLKKEGQTLRPLLPKPAVTPLKEGQLLVGGLRIKQVTRIGSDKPGDLEVTPSTSKTSVTSSAGSTRGRRKYSKRSYYAYVTESESEGEDGGMRKKKKKKKEGDEMVSGRRSKRASMSQKLAQWGLLPSGKEEEEGEEGESNDFNDDGVDDEAKNLMFLAGREADSKSEASLDVDVKPKSEDEEDDDEPLIAAPPPKFINVPLSEQTETSLAVNKPTNTLVSTPAAPIELPTTSTIKPEQVTPVATSAPPKPPATTLVPSGKVASTAEKEINSVLDLEELLSDIEKNKTSNKVSAPLKAVSTQSSWKVITPTPKTITPSISHTPSQTASNASFTQPLKTITPSGWLKKASNMLQNNRSTPTYKRMDTMNKSLMCKPIMLTKGTIFNPLRIHKSTQTDEEEVLEKKSMVVPIPVPFYMPAPTTPCLLPSTHPVPIPLPSILPCAIPASRTSVNDLIKQLEQQLSETSKDTEVSPLEDDLLQIAELISSTKTEQDRQVEEYNASIIRGVNDSEYVYPTTTPARERHPKQEQWLTRTATLPDDPKNFVANVPGYMDSSRSEEAMEGVRFSKDSQPLPFNDDHMKLKYSYAMQVWHYWTDIRNRENAKRMNMMKGRTQFYFQADPLKSTPEQLAGSLAYFVRDVRKPDGSKFAPESVYFLCLGIQYYLRENGRDDNLFTDVTYHKFTDALNDVLAAFEMKINSQNMLICRVTEDHLWEAAQLGCHSPYILLFTLVYFNTKHFLLNSVDDHLKLTANNFIVTSETKSHRTVKKLTLKLNGEDGGSVYENTDDPLKCPVQLHQFYISKCADVQGNFYCLPEVQSKGDSMMWFSHNPLSKGALCKVVNRCLVVREVQVANLQQMQIEG